MTGHNVTLNALKLKCNIMTFMTDNTTEVTYATTLINQNTT